MSAAVTLFFPQLARSIACRVGETIFQAARRNGVRLVGACAGRGTCGSCMVTMRNGAGDARAEPDPAIDEAPAPERRWLRACQARPLHDCTIEIAPRSLAQVVRSEVDAASNEALPCEAAVKAYDVTLAEATLYDPVADADRLVAALPLAGATLDLAAAAELPLRLRDQGWTSRVLVRAVDALARPEIIGLAPSGRPLLGLAVDLGTTNAAGFLVDLETGRRLASLGIENPQAAWGADLVSRINHAVQVPGGAQELRERAVAALNALADDLCQAVGASARDIADIALCGNTAMHHLLLGLPVRQLGRAPFVAAVRDSLDVKARDLGLAVAPGASVHVAANIGGFVGGDHVTALLATRERWASAPVSLVMDIGTNTEISLIHDGRILSASCPSGPALEGGHITSGMRAADGAIEIVEAAQGRLQCRTIGGKAPVGICGSGVLDAVATLRALGLVNDGGRLAESHPDIALHDGQRAAVLAPGIVFSQADVRAVQLAKAAIRTGVDLLLADAGLAEAEISRFIIAGAFGAYIRIESAVAIGLLPDLPRESFEQVGNAAGAGVRQLLASVSLREEARQLAARCQYVELSTRAAFQKVFMNNIGFKTRQGRRSA